jgi:hypothetical protein
VAEERQLVEEQRSPRSVDLWDRSLDELDAVASEDGPGKDECVRITVDKPSPELGRPVG